MTMKWIQSSKKLFIYINYYLSLFYIFVHSKRWNNFKQKLLVINCHPFSPMSYSDTIKIPSQKEKDITILFYFKVHK